jgi:hypothetical protein
MKSNDMLRNVRYDVGSNRSCILFGRKRSWLILGTVTVFEVAKEFKKACHDSRSLSPDQNSGSHEFGRLAQVLHC